MSPQWLTPSDRRGTRLSIVFLVATLVMATLLAYSASDAARSHRETAESTLRDYAGLAAWEYSRRARTQLNNAFHTPVHQVRSLVVGAGEPRPLPDVVWRAVESCDCAGLVPAADAYVRVDLDRRAVAVAADNLVRSPDWLVEAIERRLAADPGIRFATAAGPSVDGERESFGAFTIVYDQAEQPQAAYGFLVPSHEIGRVLREDCSRDGLLPPALIGDLPTDSLVYITVAAASGLPLYQSPVPYDTTFSGRDTLGVRFAGLTVTAAIRPGAAENLVIGGLPTSRLPLVLGLLLLTLGVGTAALYQFRREQELARLRDRFVSGVSHELRTPLAQIRVFGELLETDNLRTDADRSRSVTVICREARRLTHLVENVLQFSNLRRSATRLALEETPVRTLIGETVEAFEPLARQRDARIVQQVDDPFVVTADRGVLSQMLLNLLDNAVKHGPAGQTVEIGARRRGDTAEVWVRDEGPGVPPAEQERIWEPYYRGSRRSGAGGSGCGIGLALVAELAALHGGRARVENVVAGARFVVELPGAAGTAAGEPPTTNTVGASA